MLKDIQWVKVMHGSACGKSYSIFPFSLLVKVPRRNVNFTTFARVMHSLTCLPKFAAPPSKTHTIFLILQRCIAASSKWPEWNFSSMDVLRKETLIILLVASALLLADPWQCANPEVTSTCGEQFPNILVLVWLKAYLRFVLDADFSFVKHTENEGETRR